MLFDIELTYYADGNASDSEALSTLLGGSYSLTGVSESEALNILIGGTS